MIVCFDVLMQNLERQGKITDNETRRISHKDQIYTKRG